MKNPRYNFHFTNQRNIAVLSIATLFIYLLFRSIYVPLVFDEAATFFHYIHKGNFIPPYAHWDANNHILNSALSYLSYILFGSSQLALRLPNLLLSILFFYYTYKIANELSSKWVSWTFIITLFFAHNFIEFFALTRGYGMSMAFLFGSIFYIMQVVKYNRIIDYLLSLLFICLAMLANLTLINTAIIIIAFLCINVLFTIHLKNRAFSLKAFSIITAFGVIPIIVLVRLLLEFKEKGLLYYGTSEGFWELSVNSLIKLLTGSTNILIPIFIILYFIFAIAIFIFQWIRSKHFNSIWNKQSIFFALFIGNFLAIMIMSYFLGINYPEDRTGIYLFPLFIGAVLFSIDAISKIVNSRIILLSLLPFLFFPIHFIYTMNLNHSTLYIEENVPPRFIQRIVDDSLLRNEPFTLGGYRMRLLTVAYQNFRTGGQLNQIQGSHYPEYLSDFQIVRAKKEEDWLKHYTVEDYEASSGLSLLKRKKTINTIELKNSYPNNSGLILKEYFNLYKGPIDTLINKNLLLKVKMKVTTIEKPFIARLVVVAKDEANNSILYEYVTLDWKQTIWNGMLSDFNASLILYTIPEEAHELSIYLWNNKKKEYKLEDIEINIEQVLEE